MTKNQKQFIDNFTTVDKNINIKSYLEKNKYTILTTYNYKNLIIIPNEKLIINGQYLQLEITTNDNKIKYLDIDKIIDINVNKNDCINVGLYDNNGNYTINNSNDMTILCNYIILKGQRYFIIWKNFLYNRLDEIKLFTTFSEMWEMLSINYSHWDNELLNVSFSELKTCDNCRHDNTDKCYECKNITKQNFQWK